MRLKIKSNHRIELFKTLLSKSWNVSVDNGYIKRYTLNINISMVVHGNAEKFPTACRNAIREKIKDYNATK